MIFVIAQKSAQNGWQEAAGVALEALRRDLIAVGQRDDGNALGGQLSQQAHALKPVLPGEPVIVLHEHVIAPARLFQ